MKQTIAAGFLAMAAALLPGTAQAQGQSAFAAKQAHLRAGPARDYPVVVVLSPGFPIAVQGCLSDYSWCDVVAGNSRGWLYAGNINYAYQGANVPVLTYGAAIGIGILAFTFNDYWGNHYRDRPWYRDRNQWAHRPPPPVRPRPLAPRPHGTAPGAAPVPHTVPRPPHSGANPGANPGSRTPRERHPGERSEQPRR